MEPITLVRWRSADRLVGFSYRDKWDDPTPEQKRIWGCEELRALPCAEFDALVARAEKAEADQRMLHFLQAAAKHPGNADLLRAMRDLGCDEPAGDLVEMRFIHPTSRIDAHLENQ